MLQFEWRGRMPFAEGLAMQEAAVVALQADPAAPERVFLLEHDPVVTVGRSGRTQGLAAPGAVAMLEAHGVEILRTNRGGDVTCHYPGQLVMYCVVRLAKRPGGVRALVHALEESALAVCGRYAVSAARREGLPGVWTAHGKLASIGLAVRQWITHHGMSLNISEDLGPFAWVTPCGAPGARADSLDRARRRVDASAPPLVMEEVAHVLAEAFRAQWRSA